MKYFKNTDLAKLYNISEKSVRNWIQASLEGKLDLQLYHERNRSYVANTTKNALLIESLATKGKKYKNTRGHKVITPVDKFYKLYSPKQILDIISNIDIYQEIPHQYSYFNSGAERWDEYTKRLAEDKSPNSLTNTLQLLELNRQYIDSLLSGNHVNIIDIGVGNGMPVKELVGHLLEKGQLKRYIAIDISQELLDIARHNFKKWFGDRVEFEGYVRDIDYERFDDLLVKESFGEEANRTTNLFLFLGGTISNFRQPNHPLITLHDSMGKNDLLIFTKKLDSEKSRRYFDSLSGVNSLAIDLVPTLLNIDESFYVIEQFFDEKKMARQARLRLKVAISIEFELEGRKRVINLNKGESILLLRVHHQNALDTIKQFDANDFDLLHTSRSLDQDYLLLLSKLKTGSDPIGKQSL